MLTLFDTRKTGAAAALLASQTLEPAETGLFAKELSDRFKELDTRAEKIQESINSLSKLFPGITIAPEKVSGNDEEVRAYFSDTGVKTQVAIAPDILAALGENTAMAEMINSILNNVIQSDQNRSLLDTDAFELEVWKGASIQAEAAYYYETYRSDNGASTLATAGLRMEYSLRVGAMLDDLINSSASGSSGKTGSATGASSTKNGTNGLSDLTNDIFSGPWRFNASFSFSSSAFFSQSGSGGSSSLFNSITQSIRMEVNLNVVIGQMRMLENAGIDASEDEFNFSWFVMQAMGLVDPLVFDLGDEGIDLRPMEDGVTFDIQGTGNAVQTGFIRGNNAFLYLDENGNGVADDIDELFGDTQGFKNGFDKLAQYDTNGDGVIDANDEIYSKLRLWRDLNGDGVNQTEESMTLEEAGIASIDLNYLRALQFDGKGNAIAERSTFTRADGTTGTVADVWLKSARV